MTYLRWAACAALCATMLLFASCGGTAFNPTPTISALYPETIPATLIGPPICTSNPSFTLNVAGNNFLTTTQAYWNGSKRTTTFNQSTGQLAVTILACDIASPGIAYVSVSNPAPGGGPSQVAAPFQISQPPNPAPSISSLSPASTTQNTLPPGGILTINGAPAASGPNSPAFIPSSQAAVNGSARATTFVSATELQVQLLAADVATVGNVTVTVTNPAPGGGVSSAQFSVTDPPNAANFPQVVSVSATGGAANGGSSSPAMSADGRYVAFYSEATNLVASGASGNIFVRDTCIGATNCTPHTIAVDLAPDGSAPNYPSGAFLAISENGRYVAFVSYARNLVAGIDPSSYWGWPEYGLGLNVFVRDLCLGDGVPTSCVPRTSLVSQTTAGEPATDDASIPSISADGRFIAFISMDRDLAPGLSESRTHIFVRDTCTGLSAPASCVPQTFGFAADSVNPEVFANWPMISASGRYVAFEAIHRSTQGVPESSEILLLDACLGTTAPSGCAPSSRTISVLADGSTIPGWNVVPSVSADGRFVAFSSSPAPGARDSLTDTLSEPYEAFVRDTCLGTAASDGCVPTTTMLQGVGTASKNFGAHINGTGRFVAFLSGAFPGGALMVRNNCVAAEAPCNPGAFPVSIAGAGQAQLLSAKAGDNFPVSADGRFIAFSSEATNLAAPTSGFGDVFLTLMPTGQH